MRGHEDSNQAGVASRAGLAAVWPAVCLLAVSFICWSTVAWSAGMFFCLCACLSICPSVSLSVCLSHLTRVSVDPLVCMCRSSHAHILCPLLISLTNSRRHDMKNRWIFFSDYTTLTSSSCGKSFTTRKKSTCAWPCVTVREWTIFFLVLIIIYVKTQPPGYLFCKNVSNTWAGSSTGWVIDTPLGKLHSTYIDTDMGPDYLAKLVGQTLFVCFSVWNMYFFLLLLLFPRQAGAGIGCACLVSLAAVADAVCCATNLQNEAAAGGTALDRRAAHVIRVYTLSFCFWAVLLWYGELNIP